MNDLVKQQPGFSLAPSSLHEAMEYAKLIATSDIVPKDYRGKEANVLVAVQMGAELGLPPLQALQNIAVINGRPSVWGDSLIAIAKAHPHCEYITETIDGKTMTATCTIKRKGEPEQKRTFSQEDAVVAGLWNKQGPWKTNPKRMLQMRARGFAIRDVFPDALRGIQVAEEVRDIPVERNMGAVDVVGEAPQEEPKGYPQEQFDINIGQWKAVVESGKKTPEELISMIETKGKLSGLQIDQILALGE